MRRRDMTDLRAFGGDQFDPRKHAEDKMQFPRHINQKSKEENKV